MRLYLILFCCLPLCGFAQTGRWMKHELTFTSQETYEHPLYDLKEFSATFTAPSGRLRTVQGFWDGGNTFRVRFAPNEIGTWRYTTTCSNESDEGLHNQSGSFECVETESPLAIYQQGGLLHQEGTYHLAHEDGTPFFWTACTAWNGALKSTDEEWRTYLQHRVNHGYNVIQLVTTQWRGCDQNSQGQVAYSGQGRLEVHPEFFQHLDQKMDQVNEFGLIAAPVLLWALPVGQGRELSPGYSLPLEEAVKLARYIIARYQGHQVAWMLGGDGRFAREYEQRWLEIGRRVFADDPPGVVAQHPHGRLWIGDNHREEDWLDIVGYQSSHSNRQGTVDWINKGEIATRWKHLPARPTINLEPNYEEIRNQITDEDVRNASYWSLFATPVAGITYGANGIWPWIREGEKILNHGQPKHVSTWRQSIDFPGSLQIGYAGEFFRNFQWWNLRPANHLLVQQPGEEQYNHFISVLQSMDQNTVLVYIPRQDAVELYLQGQYLARWFDPVNNRFQPAKSLQGSGKVKVLPTLESDVVLVLERL
ncbi:MAG: DUF4038 domain-containing protein [Bacteroidota bacterium]